MSEETEKVKNSEASSLSEAPSSITAELAVKENGASQNAPNLDRILDIPLVLSAQLGSSKILIKELLQLGPGSIVELDKLAGEPLEVLVNDKLVARGEVVMVNEKFGIRLTDVVSPTERVNKLT